ncbi:hypothetical protein BDV59DRAFT_182253 [Aspergillus ambiguus]|uniref:uncharacterized protein n=1 Tax=Aspergillus ambiguus TaxID=176160 RepID=UPI003CCCB013
MYLHSFYEYVSFRYSIIGLCYGYWLAAGDVCRQVGCTSCRVQPLATHLLGYLKLVSTPTL